MTNLEKYDKPWSKSIRDYIASLEPVFAKVSFEMNPSLYATVIALSIY